MLLLPAFTFISIMFFWDKSVVVGSPVVPLVLELLPFLPVEFVMLLLAVEALAIKVVVKLR
jgi:hypothetical protein